MLEHSELKTSSYFSAHCGAEFDDNNCKYVDNVDYLYVFYDEIGPKHHFRQDIPIKGKKAIKQDTNNLGRSTLPELYFILNVITYLGNFLNSVKYKKSLVRTCCVHTPREIYVPIKRSHKKV